MPGAASLGAARLYVSTYGRRNGNASLAARAHLINILPRTVRLIAGAQRLSFVRAKCGPESTSVIDGHQLSVCVSAVRGVRVRCASGRRL